MPPKTCPLVKLSQSFSRLSSRLLQPCSYDLPPGCWCSAQEHVANFRKLKLKLSEYNKELCGVHSNPLLKPQTALATNSSRHKQLSFRRKEKFQDESWFSVMILSSKTDAWIKGNGSQTTISHLGLTWNSRPWSSDVKGWSKRRYPDDDSLPQALCN